MCMYMYLYVYMHIRRDTRVESDTRTHVHTYTRTHSPIHTHTHVRGHNFVTKDTEGKRKRFILSSQISSVLNSVRRNVHFFRVMRKIDRKFSVTVGSPAQSDADRRSALDRGRIAGTINLFVILIPVL